jgi:hypothetical protein
MIASRLRELPGEFTKNAARHDVQIFAKKSISGNELVINISNFQRRTQQSVLTTGLGTGLGN